MAKILIVDDDPSIVEMLQFLFTRHGYTVCVARDGKAGLEAAREQRPDLIILDVMMPHMDGFSVSGVLFKEPDMRDIPIVILTAKGNSRDIFELVPNVRLYMEKPFESQDLVKRVKSLLPPSAPVA